MARRVVSLPGVAAEAATAHPRIIAIAGISLFMGIPQKGRCFA